MYKSIVFLVIPFTFAFALDLTLNFFNNKDLEQMNLLAKKELYNYNVHKEFEIIYNSNNIFHYTKDFDAILFAKRNSDKFIFNKDLISKYDPVKINEIYSEKFIDSDFPIYSKKIIRSENILINKKFESFQPYSVELVSSDWKKNFSNKKIDFIETVLPLITYENQKILFERKRLIAIRNYLQLEKTLNKSDIIYINQIAKKYQIKSKNKHKIDLLKELLFSIDIIPNSIVLAQAANESGWGTSRFAKEYNALFGQYTFDEDSGVVPFDREEGKKHLVKNFSSFDKSVESYFKNINTHYAYKKFREVRNKINKKDLKYKIKLLTDTLDVYAEDESYVDTINSIIDSNNFNQFDLKIYTFINS